MTHEPDRSIAMHRIIAILLFLFVAIAVDCSARMTTLRFDSLGCSIGVPDSWHRDAERERPLGNGDVNVLLSARRIIGGDSVDVMLVTELVHFTDRVNVADIVAFFGSGVVLDTSRPWMLGGVQAICLKGAMPDGKHIRVLNAHIKYRIYTLVFGSNRTELFDDADVEAIRASFSFIGEPAFPVLDFTRAPTLDFKFPGESADVALPSSWQRMTRRENPDEGTILVAGVDGPDSTMMVVATRDVPHAFSLDREKVMENILIGLERGSEITSKGNSTLGGVEAFDVSGYIPGRKRYYRNLVVIVNSRMFMVNISSQRKEATSEVETRPILAGISFLATPDPPSSDTKE